MMLELILAMIVIIFCLHLFFDFSQRYSRHIQDFKRLSDLNQASSQIITHQDTSQETLSIHTAHLNCEAQSIKTPPPIVFEELKPIRCTQR